MAKRGLPASVKMKHDAHYVEELVRGNKTIGKMIPIEKIKPNPEQPRVEFGDLTELTASIEEQGVLEPLLVKPYRETGEYMIIAGERRWRASSIAGLEELPCIELDVDDQTIAEIAIVENLQRKDLTIWEIADGLADLSERYGYTHEEIAKKIGKSRTTVTESMAIASLPRNIRQRCQKSGINSKSVLIEVSRQFDVDAMNIFLDEFEKNGKVHKKKSSQSITNKNNNHSNQTELKQTQTSKVIKKGFEFVSEDNKFTINIIFEDETFDDIDVLKALKAAFDNVKAS